MVPSFPFQSNCYALDDLQKSDERKISNILFRRVKDNLQKAQTVVAFKALSLLYKLLTMPFCDILETGDHVETSSVV